MQDTPSLPLLPGPHWPGVVATDSVLSMGQNWTDLHLNSVQTNNFCQIELFKIELFVY